MNLSPEVKLWVQYTAAGLVTFLGGCAPYVIPLLLDPTEPPISWRILVGSGLSALAAVYLGSRLPRPGKAVVSRQVNALERRGVKPDDMQVTTGLEDVIRQAELLRGTTQVQPSQMIVVPSINSGVSVSMARFANPRIREVLDPSEMDSEERHLERSAIRSANNE